MAEGIVHGFKMINVAEEDDGSGILTTRTGKLTLQQLQDDAAVPQSRQRVM